MTLRDTRPAAITEDDVNVRAGPGVSFPKRRAPLRQGTPVWPTDAPPVTAEGHTWRQVSLSESLVWVAEEYLSGGKATPTGPSLSFDPATPTEIQRQPWTCSIRSTMWCLKSIGIAVTPDEAQDAMSPAYVNSDVGLKDASGAGIVAALRDRWGVEAFNRNPVSFDDVAGWAGRLPVAIGGRSWGHWTAVRGFDGERLILANPGGTGPRYGQQTLDRQQFADLGPFSAVVVTGRI